MERYSNHGFAFSAGRFMASMIAGWLFAAMNPLTSGRPVSIAAAGRMAAKSRQRAADSGLRRREVTVKTR